MDGDGNIEHVENDEALGNVGENDPALQAWAEEEQQFIDLWDRGYQRDRESQQHMLLMEFCQAAFNGNIDQLGIMLDSELIKDINQQSPRKKVTALHYACRGKKLKAVKYLVERGADVNLKDIRGKNSVHFSASLGDLETLKYLISKGGDIEVVDKYNRSPLHWAAANKHIHIFKELLDAGARIYYEVSGNWQALHEAVKAGQLEIAKILIEKGSSVNAPLVSKSKVEPFSPLHIAAREGHVDCVKLLLDHGATVTCANAGNQTPLHEAAYKGATEVLHILLLHGADPHYLNNLHRTPLHEACNQGHMHCAILLLDAGSDVDARDHMNETPLCHLLRHGASKLSHEELIAFTDILLQYGANPNVQGYQEETAIMVANSFRERDVAALIYNALEIPMSLLQLCKIRIRASLGCDYTIFDAFPLPFVLRRFLLKNAPYYS